MNKKILQIASLALALVSAYGTSAQSLFDNEPFFTNVNHRGAFGSTNWADGWSSFSPQLEVYPGDANYVPKSGSGLPANPTKVEIGTAGTTTTISTDVSWSNSNYYVLNGNVVISGTLTIEAGTVIRAYNATNANKPYILVKRGGKLIAEGTKTQPIIFTSNQAPSIEGAKSNRNRGDWGGIMLMGKGKVSTPTGVRQYEALPGVADAEYGGGTTPDDNDNSGSLKYVRIEFAGNNPTGNANAEINGLTFAAVGKSTKADWIQVSYSFDDSFEWFGGKSNHKYLIAFSGSDDDFDIDEGYRGKWQFILGVKNPTIYDDAQSSGTTSNGLEFDNNSGLGGSSVVVPGNNQPLPLTNVIISNLTLVGPLKNNQRLSDLNGTGTPNARGIYRNGILIRSNNSSSIFNSIVTNYPILLQLAQPTSVSSPSVQNKALTDSITIKNNVFVSNPGNVSNNFKFLTAGTPSGVSFNIRNWIIGGPSSSAWNSVEATNNDSLLTSSNDILFENGEYTGNVNTLPAGDSAISFKSVNFALKSTSPYLTGSSFSHKKLSDNIITSSEDAIITPVANSSVYPNPISGGSLTIAESSTAFTLFNAAGKVVRAGVDTQVSVEGLEKGMYFIKLNNKTEKVVIY